MVLSNSQLASDGELRMNEKWLKKRELIILRFYRKIQIIFNAICINLYLSLDTNLWSFFAAFMCKWFTMFKIV